MRAHHGSVAREQRLEIEEMLKAGRLRGARRHEQPRARHRHGGDRPRRPGRVAAVGRARAAAHRARRPPGRRAAARQDLPEVPGRPARGGGRRRAHAGRGDRGDPHTRATRSTCSPSRSSRWSAFDALDGDEPAPVVRRARQLRAICRASELEGVLDMLSGRYPSDEFADLGRGSSGTAQTDEVVGARATRASSRSRAAARSPTAGSSASSCRRRDGGRAGRRARRGDGVRVARRARRSCSAPRPGGSRRSRRDRVIVTPAPGEPGKMPFWHGDAAGRPIELGRAIGAFMRELRADDADGRRARLRETHALDELAARTSSPTSTTSARRPASLPDDRTIVVERFRDELGDWRVVHAVAVRRPGPRAVGDGDRGAAARAAAASRSRRCGPTTGSRCACPRRREPVPIESSCCSSRTRSRSWSSRALPARRCSPPASGRTRPARAAAAAAPAGAAHAPVAAAPAVADLLAVAAQLPTVPDHPRDLPRVLRDVFDVPALAEVLADIRRAQDPRGRRRDATRLAVRAARCCSTTIAVVHVRGRRAARGARGRRRSPWTATCCRAARQRGAARAARPGRGRRARARAAGAGRGPPGAQRRRRRRPAAPSRRPAHGRGRRARVERPGCDRCAGASSRPRAARSGCAWPARSAGSRSRTRRATATRSAPARRRRAGGVPRRRSTAARRLVARWARTHGPFTADDPRRAGAWHARCGTAARAGRRRRRLLEGAFRPGGAEREWCDPDVLRQLRRRSLARLRREVEPVEPRCSRASCPRGTGSAVRPAASDAPDRGGRRSSRECRSPHRSSSATCCPLAWRLHAAPPRRARRGRRGRVDRRAGRWAGTTGGWRSTAGTASTLLRRGGPADDRPSGPIHDAIREHLQRRGASFWPELSSAAGDAPNDDELLDALWDLVWAGEVTNDTFAPLRALSLPRSARHDVSPRPGAVRRARATAGAGRWSLVADLVGDGALADRARRTPSRRAAGAPRRRDPRGGARRGHRRRVRGGLPVLRRWRSRAASVAATSWPASGRRSSPCPAPSIGCAPCVSDPTSRDRTCCWPRPTRRSRTAPPSPGRAARTTSGSARSAPPAYVAIVDGHAMLYVERGGRGLLRLPAASDALRLERADRDVAVAGRDRWTDARAADRAHRPRAGGLVDLAAALSAVGFRRVTEGSCSAPERHGPSAAWALRGPSRNGSRARAARASSSDSDPILSAGLRRWVIEVRADLDPRPALRHRRVRSTVRSDSRPRPKNSSVSSASNQVVVDVLAASHPLGSSGIGTRLRGRHHRGSPDTSRERDRIRAEQESR